MASPGRLAIATCMGLALGCGQTSGSGSPVASGGAPAGIGGHAAVAGSSAGGVAAAGNAVSELAGAGQASGGNAGAGLAEAGAAGGDEPSERSDVQLILETYRSFEPRTPAPVSVSGYIFGLCRMPTLRETEFLASLHGDGRYLQDWANPLAAAALTSQAKGAFPVGAVIVKEKYAGPHAEPADVVALGLMIKRAAGFDAAHGDWDYAYYEPALGIIQNTEQTAYCAKCHAAAAATDFVYVDGFSP